MRSNLESFKEEEKVEVDSGLINGLVQFSQEINKGFGSELKVKKKIIPNSVEHKELSNSFFFLS